MITPPKCDGIKLIRAVQTEKSLPNYLCSIDHVLSIRLEVELVQTLPVFILVFSSLIFALKNMNKLFVFVLLSLAVISAFEFDLDGAEVSTGAIVTLVF